LGAHYGLRSFVYYFRLLCLVGRLIVKVFLGSTGNFGDIFAGYLAKKNGLPKYQLVVATNKNDLFLLVVITQERT